MILGGVDLLDLGSSCCFGASCLYSHCYCASHVGGSNIVLGYTRALSHIGSESICRNLGGLKLLRCRTPSCLSVIQFGNLRLGHTRALSLIGRKSRSCCLSKSHLVSIFFPVFFVVLAQPRVALPETPFVGSSVIRCIANCTRENLLVCFCDSISDRNPVCRSEHPPSSCKVSTSSAGGILIVDYSTWSRQVCRRKSNSERKCAICAFITLIHNIRICFL
mmetsp:Transcript_25715/g.46585  ORF Transcript_25715/g.46585 Transcript_25715/m.46585 type:complete len:220 (-) Transcript_25715:123-782(-)